MTARTLHGRRWRAPRSLVALLLALLAAPATHAAPYAYIGDIFSNSLSVIDVATNTVVATVPVGNSPQGIAVNKFGTRVYVANANSNSVSVVDAGSNTVITTIPLGSNAIGVAVSPDGTRVYVTLQFANQVKVINATNNTVLTTIAVPNPFGIVVSPDGTRVYVATDAFGGPLSVIDTASNTITASVPIGNVARGVAVNPAGTRVYVANQSSGTVSVVDTASNTVVATVPVGTYPYGVAVNAAGTRVYVTNNGSSSISLIDTATNTVVKTISLNAGYPGGVAINQAGTVIYATQTQPGAVAVIGSRCNDTTTSIAAGSAPIAMGLFIGPGGDPPPPPPEALTTQVTGIEVTQSIQDVANTVPLVLSKRTFARVYVQADVAAVAGVTASLTGEGAFMSGGSEVRVPLGTLVPSNPPGPRITVVPSPKRGLLANGFLFELPWAWSNYAALRLHAQLSPPEGEALPSCKGDVASAPIHEFRTFTTLKVAFVRMAYVFPGIDPATAYKETSLAEQRRSESWIQRAYPVSQLSFAPDFVLFDPLLGIFVDQSALLCQLLDADKKSLCAYYYLSGRLAALAKTSSYMDGADAAHGLIPQTYLPQFPDTNPYYTRGACCAERKFSVGAADQETTAAHEVAHRLGRKHPVPGSSECGHTPDDPNYPYFFSFLAPPLSDPNTSLAGFDAGDPSLLIPLNFYPPATTFDLMSYCGSTRWLSDYQYRSLAIDLEALHPGIGVRPAPGEAPAAAPTAPTPPQPGDWLLVFGNIAGDLGSALLFDVRRVDRVFDVPPRPPGSFSIRLLDAVGGTLADYPFTPDIDDDATAPGGVGAPLRSFGHVVPFVPGTRQVRILDNNAGGAVLTSAAVSANAPSVSDVLVQGGPDPVTGALSLGWSASDADNEPLRFDVYVVRNAGAILMPLKLGVQGTSAQVDTAGLGGGNAQFRVIANDGLQTGFADSAVVPLPNRPPQPRINNPGSDTHVTLGQVVNFDGSAFDPQDGALSGAALSWSTPALGVLGTGTRISVTTLPVGVHLVTLTAIGSAALGATRSVIVTVASDTGTPGPTLSAGPLQIGWQVATGSAQLQSAILEVGNRGSGTLQFQVASGANWLSSNVLSGAAPATLTLSADPAGLPDATTTETTLTLSAVGHPEQTITIPVRLSVGDTFDAGTGRPPPPPNLVYGDGFEAVPAARPVRQ